MCLVKFMKLKKNRDGTFEYGKKCVDIVLASEGILETVEGIKLIEYNEIVNPDYRGYFIALHLEEYFDEDFNKENKREQMLLNTIKRSHRKCLVKYAKNYYSYYQ